jgi:hypothetical protein
VEQGPRMAASSRDLPSGWSRARSASSLTRSSVPAITTMMLVRGLVERDRAGDLKMTQQGYEVFKVLIGG